MRKCFICGSNVPANCIHYCRSPKSTAPDCSNSMGETVNEDRDSHGCCDVRRIPNPVRQTTPTNCFRACVAMVLDLPIDDVPAACDGATWDWDAFQDWLAGRGLQLIEIGFGNGGTIYPVRKPVRCIITGKSHRECKSGQHAVVGSLLGLEGFSLDNDPHPSDLWIDGEPTHAGFFVPMNPVV